MVYIVCQLCRIIIYVADRADKVVLENVNGQESSLLLSCESKSCVQSWVQSHLGKQSETAANDINDTF